jgi:uncharacterized membrane protein
LTTDTQMMPMSAREQEHRKRLADVAGDIDFS